MLHYFHFFLFLKNYIRNVEDNKYSLSSYVQIFRIKMWKPKKKFFFFKTNNPKHEAKMQTIVHNK